MRTSPACTGPGATCQVSRSAARPRLRAARNRRRVISMCGSEGTGRAPSCTTRGPRRSRAGEQQRRRRTGWRPRRRSGRTAAHRAGAAHRERQRPRPPSSTATPSARSASITAHRRVARVRRHRRRRRSPVARAATGGTKRITVPASPQSIEPPVQGRRGDRPVGPRSCDRRCRAPPARSAISRCRASAGRGVRREGPSASAASTQRTVGQRLRPRQLDARVDGSSARGAGHRSSASTPRGY